MNDVAREAQLFGKYLVGDAPSQRIVKQYRQALQHAAKLSPEDKKFFAFVAQHPRSLGLVDAGLVFYQPYSELRRRLYIMVAIMEANPEYCDHFLPVKRGPFYPAIVMWCGIRAIVKAIIGSGLVRVISR